MPDDQADKGAQGGAENAGKTANDKGSASAGAGQEDGEEFDKERAMATIRKLRESEKTGKAALKELETIRAEKVKADEDALKKQGDWQKLAEDAQAKLKELEPHKAKAEKYEAALSKLLASQRKDLPAHVLKLLDKLDPAEQLEYIAENREALVPNKASPPNVNATAGQAGKPSADPKAREAELRQRFRF